MLRTLFLVIFTLVVVSGCGTDIEKPEPAPESEPELVRFVSAAPPSGSEIAANASITITFDGVPTIVTSNIGTVTTAGKNATVAGPFTPGLLVLTIMWEDGSQTLTYTGTSPCAPPLVHTNLQQPESMLQCSD